MKDHLTARDGQQVQEGKMRTEYKYIKFEQWPAVAWTGKTSKWQCVANSDCSVSLGAVRWEGGWRQYVFWPDDCCMFSNGCLRDIADFLDQLNADHKEKSK
jgi:hypothetical protein